MKIERHITKSQSISRKVKQMIGLSFLMSKFLRKEYFLSLKIKGSKYMSNE